tara:strand:+ start:1885 stop:2115 length:231 start_codon:yes stop_codon:yes gene_type:complete
MKSYSKKDLEDIFIQIFKINDIEIIHNLELNKIPKWDSLGHLRLILAIEKKFNIKISNDKITQLTSFSLLLSYLKL